MASPFARSMASCGIRLAFFFVASSATCLAGGFDKAIEEALPRVVKLYGLGAGQQKGFGSGVLVSPDGLVVTVYSLLVDADTVRAVTADGALYEAKVVSHDRQRQLSLLRLVPLHDESLAGRQVDDSSIQPKGTNDQGSRLRFPFFETSCTGRSTASKSKCGSNLRPGDWVLAAGNAFKVADGTEPVSITHGVFSAKTRLDARRRMRDFPYEGDVLVIDAITSNPGEPGAALVNLTGEFVGLIGREVVSNLTHTHFNYAIPRDVVSSFLEDALEAEREGRFVVETVEEPGLDDDVDPGLRITRAGFRTVLPFVERVVRGSSADRAGIRKDDLVLAVNGRNVADADEYYAEIKKVRRGEAIDLVLRRDRRILTVQIGVPSDEPQ